MPFVIANRTERALSVHKPMQCRLRSELEALDEGP